MLSFRVYGLAFRVQGLTRVGVSGFREKVYLHSKAFCSVSILLRLCFSKFTLEA